MPRATINTDSQRYELKSLPEGFVVLKRMSYGQWLHRQELAMKLQIDGGKKGDGMKGEMVMANKAVTVFELSQCIVDHNLEHDNGEKLDFRQPQTLDILDPRIGNEISGYIMELHEFDSGNSQSGSLTSSAVDVTSE